MTIEHIQKIEADLILAFAPVWLLEKEEQKKFLEMFVNKIIAKTNAIHDGIPTLERVE